MQASRQIVEPGCDYAMPPDGAICYLQVLDDAHGIFSDSETTLTLGVPDSEERLALEQAIMKMRPGEVDRINLSTADGTTEKSVSLKLKHFDGRHIFQMDVSEKWRLAKWHKDYGVTLCSDITKLALAFRQFSLALKYIISLALDVPKAQHDDEEMNINRLRMLLYVNMSACQLKAKNYDAAVANATKGLAIDPANSKALYRRGTALLYLQEFERSREDLLAARKLAPGNTMIEDSLKELHIKMSQLDSKYSEAMKKMFG